MIWVMLHGWNDHQSLVLINFIYTGYYFWVKIYFIVLSAMSEKKPYTKYFFIGTSFNHGGDLK